MCSLSFSPFKDRFSVAWRAVLPDYIGYVTNSEEFHFQNAQFCFQFQRNTSQEEYSILRMVLVGGQVTAPFTATVLVERRDGCRPVCRSLACERVSQLPWECSFLHNRNLLHNFAAKVVYDPYNAVVTFVVRFIVILENDSTSGRNDNIERPIQMECAQGTSNDSDFPSNLENLSLDLANLLMNETLPDVKLKCGGRDRAIPAHRVVLAARSEVFAAMFRNEMSESRSGDVDVPDVEEDVIDPFLQYVYSGQIPSGVSDEVVPGLYAAADKYAVHALRETCRDRMVRALTDENCVEFLTVADAHGDADFKKSVIEYMCSHDAVFSGDAWREFAKKPSLLAMEVYQSFVDRKSSAIQSSRQVTDFINLEYNPRTCYDDTLYQCSPNLLSHFL